MPRSIILAPPSGSTQTATLTVNNSSAATATVALTPSYIPSGVTFTGTPSSVTVGPGTTASPTTATATVSLGVRSGSSLAIPQLNVNGAASGYNEVTVPVALAYNS